MSLDNIFTLLDVVDDINRVSFRPHLTDLIFLLRTQLLTWRFELDIEIPASARKTAVRPPSVVDRVHFLDPPP